jgi:hypothetical protein
MNKERFDEKINVYKELKITREAFKVILFNPFILEDGHVAVKSVSRM